MDIATPNRPHLARRTRRADPRPRAVPRLCCSQECLAVRLNVKIIFHETGAEIWYFVQMWLATLEGSMLCGNDRTGDQSQAGMFRYYCIAFFLPKTDSANSSRIVLPKSFPLKICPPNFFHQNSSTKFTKPISLVTNSHSFLSLVIYRIYFSKSFP